MSFLEESGSGPETEGQPEGSPEVPSTPELSPYGQKFLQEVPEEERGIISKYLPKWDGGFTKYAQGVQGQLKAYKDLGEPTELQQARQVYQKLIDDPQGVANWLHERGYTVTPQGNVVPETQNQNGQQKPEADPYKDRWDKVDRMERALGMLADNYTKQQEAQQQAQAEKELDQYLQNPVLKGIPEQFTLAIMHSGETDPAAIKAQWTGIAQQTVNQQHANKPPNIMGSSSQPPPAQDPTNMTTDQRQAALLARLGDFGS